MREFIPSLAVWLGLAVHFSLKKGRKTMFYDGYENNQDLRFGSKRVEYLDTVEILQEDPEIPEQDREWLHSLGIRY